MSDRPVDERAWLVAAVNAATAKQPPQETRTTLGLALPVLPATIDIWEDSHVELYLTTDEYLPQYCAKIGIEPDQELWVASLVQPIKRLELLRVLSVANLVAAERGEKLDRWTRHVMSNLIPELRELVQSAHAALGPTRHFLARQPILQAMKLVLTYDYAPIEMEPKDSATVATLLSHYACKEGHPPTKEEPYLGVLPQSLALEFVQNGHFYDAEDIGVKLARHRGLWVNYESRLTRYPPRAPHRTMLKEASGLDFDEIITIGFYCYSRALHGDIGTVGTADLAALKLDTTILDAFLALFARTPEEFAAELRGHESDWDFGAFERCPLLRVGETEVVVLDGGLLINRITSALYWLVHDYEKTASGTRRVKWTQTYAELVELHAEDQLRRMAPPLLGGGSTMFTEEQLSYLGGKNADVGIDYGSTVLLIDVVQHQMTVKTRHGGDVEAFKSDVEASVVKKAQQLDETATKLLSAPLDERHPLRRRPTSLICLAVQGATFPVNPITVSYTVIRCTELGLFAQPEVKAFGVVSVTELEILESLVEKRGVTVPDVLLGWQTTHPHTSLRNYLYNTYGGKNIGRPAAVQRRLREQFDVIGQRVRLYLGDDSPTSADWAAEVE